MSQWHNLVKYGGGTFFLELGSDGSPPGGGDGQGGGLDMGGGGGAYSPANGTKHRNSTPDP